MKRMYFIPEIGLLVLIGLFSILPKSKGKKEKKGDKEIVGKKEE